MRAIADPLTCLFVFAVYLAVSVFSPKTAIRMAEQMFRG
jgi:hypothetical protein